MISTEFKFGDRVAISARFLRSMGTVNFGGGNSGLSRYDLGKGTIVLSIGSDLFQVWFDIGELRTFNAFNLVHVRDIHAEAMRAENIGIRKLL